MITMFFMFYWSRYCLQTELRFEIRLSLGIIFGVFTLLLYFIYEMSNKVKPPKLIWELLMATAVSAGLGYFSARLLELKPEDPSTILCLAVLNAVLFTAALKSFLQETAVRRYIEQETGKKKFSTVEFDKELARFTDIQTRNEKFSFSGTGNDLIFIVNSWLALAVAYKYYYADTLIVWLLIIVVIVYVLLHAITLLSTIITCGPKTWVKKFFWIFLYRCYSMALKGAKWVIPMWILFRFFRWFGAAFVLITAYNRLTKLK